MSYKYSICYPDKKDIQYFDTPISSKEVISIAENFNWVEELTKYRNLAEEQLFYNPSIDFQNITEGISFCLTAEFTTTNQLEFSIWFCRPKKVKKLFGLLGTTEKNVVDDAWHFTFDQAMKYLQHFLNKNYQPIQELFN